MNRVIRRRRRRQSNNIKSFITIIVVALLFIYLLHTAFKSTNVQGDINQPDKGYISIVIDTGDTLWSIANEHMDTDYYTYKTFIDELIKVNQIKDTKIYAGEELLVPILATN